MDKEVYEVRLANWKQLIRQCQNRPDGMTQKDWLKQHEIPESQFYYWLRKIRKEALAGMKAAESERIVPMITAASSSKESVAFAEIDLTRAQALPESCPQSHAAAVIRLGRLSVELSNNADERLISGILKAVSHAC